MQAGNFLFLNRGEFDPVEFWMILSYQGTASFTSSHFWIVPSLEPLSANSSSK